MIPNLGSRRMSVSAGAAGSAGGAPAGGRKGAGASPCATWWRPRACRTGHLSLSL